VDVVIDPRNARKHTPENLAAIARSLRDLGAGRSIVVDREGTIIGGNAVFKKAQELGLPLKFIHTRGDALVVVVRDDLSPDDPRRKALALADNQTALLAEWDFEVLKDLIGEISLSDVDLDLEDFGFENVLESLEATEKAEESESVELNVPGRLEATEQEKQLLDGKTRIAVAFSGGRDSTVALLWAVANAGGREVYPIYCDMGVGYPAASEHARAVCRSLGLELTVVKPRKDFWELLDRKGWPHFHFPWCQGEMLHPALDSAVKELGDLTETLYIWGGTRHQKAARSQKKPAERYRGIDTYSPLYSWSRKDIAKVLGESGVLQWRGYRLGFPRTACWMCPGQRPLGYAALRRWYPGLWRELLRWERRLGIGAWNPAGQKPGTGFQFLADKGEPELEAFLKSINFTEDQIWE